MKGQLYEGQQCEQLLTKCLGANANVNLDKTKATRIVKTYRHRLGHWDPRLVWSLKIIMIKIIVCYNYEVDYENKGLKG